MTARTVKLVGGLLLLAAIGSAEAPACPLCDSSTAVDVRAGFVDDFTPTTLAAVVVPFIMVAGAISVIHFGVPNLRSKR